jgi:hypothetical protein
MKPGDGGRTCGGAQVKRGKDDLVMCFVRALSHAQKSKYGERTNRSGLFHTIP